MRKYVVMGLTAAGDKTREWEEWGAEHVAKMMRVPGYISGQAFRRRKDMTFIHPEVVPTLPPYDRMTFYEVDEEGLQFLTTHKREAGAGSLVGGGFPSPLGPYVGDSYLWETLSPEYRATGDRPTSATRYVTVLTDTSANPEEWRQWGQDHAANTISLPIFTSTQAFGVRPDFSAAHPESESTRPPYKLMTFYEITDAGFEHLMNDVREMDDGPEAGTRTFPSPLGKHVGDTFMWEAISPRFRALRD